jgi:hypothetical protein
MERQINWNKEDIIYNASYGAKPGYVGISGKFNGYTIRDYHLMGMFDNKPQRKQILAVNNIGEEADVIITEHVWTIVKKKDLPKGIEDYFK